MEEKSYIIDPLMERIESFGKTSLELIKLKTLKQSATILSSIISRGLAFVFLSLFLIMINIAVSMWLGEILGKPYYGFLCVSGFYLIITSILFFAFHKLIKKQVSNFIISQALN